MDPIKSVQNPKIKEARKLWKRRERDETNLFLVEGYRELSRCHLPLQHLFICPSLFLGTNERALISRLNCPTYEVDEKVFFTLSYRDRPDGLLAVAKQKHQTLKDLSPLSRACYVVAEAIEKPGNLGTILRSSDGCGADGVIVCDRCTDIYNPNVVRASVGTLFTQPVIEASSEETLAWLQKNGIPIIAATPAAERLYTDVDLTGPVAIAV
ncbi:MAG: TrmH family RNA methyltransferase, partial [Chlamydiales bacterium]